MEYYVPIKQNKGQVLALQILKSQGPHKGQVSTEITNEASLVISVQGRKRQENFWVPAGQTR